MTDRQTDFPASRFITGQSQPFIQYQLGLIRWLTKERHARFAALIGYRSTQLHSQAFQSTADDHTPRRSSRPIHILRIKSGDVTIERLGSSRLCRLGENVFSNLSEINQDSKDSSQEMCLCVLDVDTQ